MTQEIIIRVSPWETRAFVFESGTLTDVFLEQVGKGSLLGNIYIGKIARILPALEGAFVDIGLEKNAFIKNDSFLGNSNRIGDQIVVQIISEPTKKKGAKVTQDISIVGRHLVYHPQKDLVALSETYHVLPGQKQFGKEFDNIEELEHNFIARTGAKLNDLILIQKEAKSLRQNWVSISSRIKEAKIPELLFEDRSMPIRIIRECLRESASSVWVNDKRTFSEIKKFLSEFIPNLENCLKFSARPKFIGFQGYERQIESVFARKIGLSGGGQIVIDHTEAMTVIDVNSGSFNGNEDRKVFVRKINLQAAEEIMRQLRLRNIGGLIAVDFINMEDIESRKRVRDAIERARSRDKKVGRVSEISEFGVIEMSRRGESRSLDEICRESCDACGGAGYIKTSRSICLEIFDEILDKKKRYREKICLVSTSRSVANLIEGELRPLSAALSASLDIVIKVKAQSHFKPHEYHIATELFR